MSSAFESLTLLDDGTVPNNAALPLRLYRAAVPAGAGRATASVIAMLAGHGWGGAWINGIHPFHHYHALAHEVLVITAGSVDVQLGGSSGPIESLRAGDAVMIPAGVGHCRRGASGDLEVVGAYPAGQENWDLRRATQEDRALALGLIARVPLPRCDPITGAAYRIG